MIFKLRINLGCLAPFLLLPLSALAADATHPQDMLRDWLTQKAMGQLAARQQKVDALSTPEQIRNYSRDTKVTLLRMIGGLPAERTPLNARRTGVIDRGDYRVEKIIFESSPRFYVTGNLYIPQTGKPPYPAVLQPTGHSVQAKARAFYQTLSIGLVKSGFVVLTYDPLGQGERRIFFDPELQDSKVGGTTIEHQVVGLQSLLAGESIARYMIWDAMRAVDFLESRAEVIRDRIGVAGCSGGGTLTAYLAALDPRLKAAAPACYITNWEDQLKGTGPQDAEQQFPDYLRDGFNHGDLIIAALPKPYLMCSTERDFFPLEGARKTFEEVKRIYGRLGMEDRIAWAVGPGGHGMPKNVREAIYGWMNHWLKGAPSTKAVEPEIRTEFEEDLNCTPTGQLSTSLGGETASTMNLKRYVDLLPPRKPLATLADVNGLRADIHRKVLSLTRYESSKGSLRVTEGERMTRPGYMLQRLSYDADGRRISALLATPDPAQSRGKTLLFLDQAGHVEYEKSASDLEQFAQAGYTVLAIDPSGVGETTPKWSSYSDYWFGQDKTTWLALMIGRPLVGLRMGDILRGIDLLSERGLLVDGGCAAFGKGRLSVDLLFAAAVDDRIRALDLEGGLISYQSIVSAPIARRIFDEVVPQVLKNFDLQDLAAAFAPRPLRMRNLVTPLGITEFIGRARQSYRFASEAYSAAGARDKLEIGLRREDETVLEAYPVR